MSNLGAAEADISVVNRNARLRGGWWWKCSAAEWPLRPCVV